MPDAIIIQPQPRAWLEHSVLSPFVDRYVENLQHGGYSRSTTRVYLCCIAHFAHWLTAERIALSAVNEVASAHAQGRRSRFFEALRSLTVFMVFPDWDNLIATLAFARASP